MTVPVIKTVNGSVRTLIVEVRMTLLDALRGELSLTGRKNHVITAKAERVSSLSMAAAYSAPAFSITPPDWPFVDRMLWRARSFLHRSSNFHFCSF